LILLWFIYRIMLMNSGVTKVLLVEDDDDLREIYSARLLADGMNIITATNGEEGLAAAVKERPDIIVADVMMPKISGFDMLDILRQTPETKDTKIIMVTALGSEDDRSRGDRLGANKYLVKSQMTTEDLVQCIHSVVNGPAPSTTDTNAAATQANNTASVADSTDIDEQIANLSS